MDTVIALKRPEDYTAVQGARFEVHFEKARGFSGDEAKSFVVQLQQEGGQYHWLCDRVAESQYERAVGLLKGGMAQKALQSILALINPLYPGGLKRQKMMAGYELHGCSL